MKCQWEYWGQSTGAWETTDLPISENATRCGFYDQSHLTHAFRQKRGVTPGEYRRKSRG